MISFVIAINLIPNSISSLLYWKKTLKMSIESKVFKMLIIHKRLWIEKWALALCKTWLRIKWSFILFNKIYKGDSRPKSFVFNKYGLCLVCKLQITGHKDACWMCMLMFVVYTNTPDLGEDIVSYDSCWNALHETNITHRWYWFRCFCLCNCNCNKSLNFKNFSKIQNLLESKLCNLYFIG